MVEMDAFTGFDHARKVQAIQRDTSPGGGWSKRRARRKRRSGALHRAGMVAEGPGKLSWESVEMAMTMAGAVTLPADRATVLA